MKKSIFHKQTLHEAIYATLLRELVSGKIPPGSPLPSRSELEKRFAAGKETVKRVLKRLALEGYIHPRSSRSALAARKLPMHHYTVAMPLITDCPLDDFLQYDQSPWGYLIFVAISQALLRKGHTMVLLDGKMHNAMLPAGIDGVICLRDDPFEWAVRYPDLPILTINPAEDRSCSAVMCDFSEAFTKVAVYMLSCGVKSILLLGYNPQTRLRQLKYLKSAFIGTVLEHGIPESAIHWGPEYCVYERSEAVQAVDEFLQTSPELPLGVMTAGDLLAAGAVEAAIKHNLTVKKDFFVVGGTGLKEVETWSPALSTVGTPFEELGNKTADLLTEYIRSGVPPPSELVKCKFVKRDS